MKKITRKRESDWFLEERGFNTVNLLNTEASEIARIEKFMDLSAADRFSLRDKSRSCGAMIYDVTPQEILSALPNYNRVCIYDSMKVPDANLILQGDVQVNKDFTGIASLSDIPSITNRVAMGSPQWRISFDMSEYVPYVKGFDTILDFVVTQELFGAIVEFTLFAEPVGKNHEPIIIWEVRNY